MRVVIVVVAVCLSFAPVLAQAPASGRRVAITIDDGPVVNELSDLGNFQRVTRGLIDAFVAEKVPVTNFINERQLNVPGQRDARAAALERWLDAGFDLANHTYSHPSANQVPLAAYLDDVIKGEVIMRPLVEQRGRTLSWLRYPYLHAGATADTHRAILDFLAARGYRVAPVTVDYADYSFAGAYVRELRAGNAEKAGRIRQAYLDQVDAGFEYAEKASVEVFGREIPQILLIHCNELNSVSLRESIARMRARGYSFITLDEAMNDAAYQRPDTFTGPGGSWLSRSAAAAGRRIETPQVRVPAWVGQ
jgi:peptidoglycan/xylan/chitin deacetylase (PgdA/CDA1 family)